MFAQDLSESMLSLSKRAVLRTSWTALRNSEAAGGRVLPDLSTRSGILDGTLLPIDRIAADRSPRS
ncbi:hypothetical protein [Streptomyces sp. WAC 04229]|uniref:hypothetical protein n=1 Tax=Streptomyces sp. WAC 04229 TaxID=2203206 RepID=UPI000F74AB84|nr:hypothetical protein [Streptomyces sp. WAC 04229]